MAMNNVRVALVQGGTRGIGLQFVKRLAAQPQVEKVFATGRSALDPQCALNTDPTLKDKVVPVAVDLASESSIQQACGHIQDSSDRLHFVLNASGFLHRHEQGVGPERKLDQVCEGLLEENFRVNAYAPILWAKHLSSLLKHKDPAVFASISARVGSISDNRMGGWYSYRASKAAQNMLMRCLALEWARTHKSVTVLSLHPGTVQTDLSAPFSGNVRPGKLFSPEQAVNYLWSVINSTTAKDTGKFFAWDGKEIPF